MLNVLGSIKKKRSPTDLFLPGAPLKFETMIAEILSVFLRTYTIL